MTFPATYRAVNRIRFFISILLSIIIHLSFLMLLDYLGVFTQEKPPAKLEPLVIQLGSPADAVFQRQEKPEKEITPPSRKPEASTKVSEARETPETASGTPTKIASKPVKPDEDLTQPKTAASPWGLRSEAVDPKLAGDPYGDIPTKITGGLKALGEPVEDSSREREFTELKPTVERYFDSEAEKKTATPVTENAVSPGTETESSGVLGNWAEVDKRIAEGLKQETDAETDTETDEKAETDIPADSPFQLEWEDSDYEREILRIEEVVLSNIKDIEAVLLTVRAEILIDTDGNVSDVRILESSGYTEVDAAVRKALNRWKFASVSEESGSIKARVIYRIEIK
jgi:TonB family protein